MPDHMPHSLTPNLWLVPPAGRVFTRVFWFLSTSFQCSFSLKAAGSGSSSTLLLPGHCPTRLLLSRDPWPSLFGGVSSLSSSRAGFCSLSLSPQQVAGPSVPASACSALFAVAPGAAQRVGPGSNQYAERASDGVCSLHPPESGSHRDHPCEVSRSRPLRPHSEREGVCGIL